MKRLPLDAPAPAASSPTARIGGGRVLSRAGRLLGLVVLGGLLVVPGGGAWARSLDLVVALDNSGSMKKNDPDRLTLEMVKRLWQGLPAGSHLALVLFDRKAEAVFPFTPVGADKTKVLINGLNRLNYLGQWTNLQSAVELSLYQHKLDGRPGSEKAVVLLTDGVMDTGDRAKDQAGTAWLQTDLAAEAAERGVRIFGIGLSAEADFMLLQTLARKTRGEYYRVLNPEDLEKSFGHIQQQLADLARDAPLAPPAPSETLPREAPAPPVAAVTPISPAPSRPEAPPPTPAVVAPPPPAVAPPPPVMATPPEQEKPPVLPAPNPAPVAEPAPRKVAPPAPPVVSGARVGEWWWLVLAGVGFLGVVGGLWSRRRSSPLPEAVVVPPRETAPPAPEPVRPPAQRAPEEEAFAPTLVLKDQSGVTGQEKLELVKKTLLVGRIASPNPAAQNLVLPDDGISRLHAIVQYRDYAFFARDNSSTNGTWLNDVRVADWVVLNHGDVLRFDRFPFEVIQPEMEGSHRTVVTQGTMVTAAEAHPATPKVIVPVARAEAEMGATVKGPAPSLVQVRDGTLMGELADEGGHTAKMSGARGVAEPVGTLPLDEDTRALAKLLADAMGAPMAEEEVSSPSETMAMEVEEGKTEKEPVIIRPRARPDGR